jgi:hypothetical protein
MSAIPGQQTQRQTHTRRRTCGGRVWYIAARRHALGVCGYVAMALLHIHGARGPSVWQALDIGRVDFDAFPGAAMAWRMCTTAVPSQSHRTYDTQTCTRTNTHTHTHNHTQRTQPCVFTHKCKRTQMHMQAEVVARTQGLSMVRMLQPATREGPGRKGRV